MKTLSSCEITQISGGFSATNILNSAENGFLFAAFLGVCFGAGLPAFPTLLRAAAIFGGLTLARESAEYFDDHYGTPPKKR